jgi:hypothetical protein
VDAYRFQYNVEPCSSFGQKADDEYVIQLDGCFDDDDPPEDLQYNAKVLPASAPRINTWEELEAAVAVDAAVIGVQQDPDGRLTITPVKPGDYMLACAVKDNDSQSAIFVKLVQVISLSAATLRNAQIYIGIFLAVVLAGLAIWQKAKPAFESLAFELLRDGAFRTQKNLPRSKKGFPLTKFSSVDVLQGAPITAAMLRNIYVLPGKNSTAQILVKSKAANVSVSINAQDLKPGKKYSLSANSALSVKATRDGIPVTISWRLKKIAKGTPGASPTPASKSTSTKRPY